MPGGRSAGRRASGPGSCEVFPPPSASTGIGAALALHVVAKGEFCGSVGEGSRAAGLATRSWFRRAWSGTATACCASRWAPSTSALARPRCEVVHAHWYATGEPSSCRARATLTTCCHPDRARPRSSTWCAGCARRCRCSSSSPRPMARRSPCASRACPNRWSSSPTPRRSRTSGPATPRSCARARRTSSCARRLAQARCSCSTASSTCVNAA